MKYLITGVAGSGKTTIANRLADKGLTVYDMDSVEGLCSWINTETGEKSPDNRESEPSFLDNYDWYWNGSKLLDLLDSDEDIYFFGSSGNQRDMFKLFDRIFLLEMTADLIRERIFDDKRENSYGQMPGEIETILGYHKGLEEEVADAGAVVVDASKPVEEIIDLVLSYTET